MFDIRPLLYALLTKTLDIKQELKGLCFMILTIFNFGYFDNFLIKVGWLLLDS